MGRPKGKSDLGTVDAVTRCRLWLTTAALALAGCAGPFPQSTLRPRSDYGRAIDHLFTDIFWWAVIVFVIVETLLLIALIRFRHREGGPAPKPLHGHTALEIGWTLAPAVILVLVAVPTVRTIFATAGDAPPDALKVEVIGHQWWWEITYPNSQADQTITTANEIHVPIDTPVVVLTNSTDVIHSFWAPNLDGKKDLIPGHETVTWFRADTIGVYRGQCAEFCGYEHARMAFYVVAEPRIEFERWLAQQRAEASTPGDSLAQEGERVFLSSSCAMCHSIAGTGAGSNNGPDLTHLASRRTIAAGTLPNNAANLEAWILAPQTIKPGAKMPANRIDPQSLRALVAYLQGLK